MTEDEYIEDGVPSIYSMLIRPIRYADQSREGREFLRRYLQRPNELFKQTLDDIRSLEKLDSPATCPEELLQYFKHTVGFTSELDHITSRLSTNSLRRLISLAVPLWQHRGTAEGLAEWVRLLTGRAVDWMGWFDYRWILGESALGLDEDGHESWLIGGETSRWDEYLSHLRVMDRGTLDRQLLLDLAQLSRPSSERMEIAIVDFLDRFDEGRGLWTHVAGAPATVDGARRRMLLPAGTTEEASLAVVTPASYGDHTAIIHFRLVGAADVLIVQWSTFSGEAYHFQLTLRPFDGVNPEFKLEQVPGTVIAQGPIGSFRLHSGADYSLRLQTDASAGSVQLKVYFDESLIVNVNQSVPSSPHGTLRLIAPAGNTGSVEIAHVQMFRNPLRFALVSKDGTTTSSNFFVR